MTGSTGAVRRIMAVADGTDDGDAAARWAVSPAAGTAAELRIVQVLDPRVRPDPLTGAPAGDDAS